MRGRKAKQLRRMVDAEHNAKNLYYVDYTVDKLQRTFVAGDQLIPYEVFRARMKSSCLRKIYKDMKKEYKEAIKNGNSQKYRIDKHST